MPEWIGAGVSDRRRRPSPNPYVGATGWRCRRPALSLPGRPPGRWPVAGRQGDGRSSQPPGLSQTRARIPGRRHRRARRRGGRHPSRPRRPRPRWPAGSGARGGRPPRRAYRAALTRLVRRTRRSGWSWTREVTRLPRGPVSCSQLSRTSICEPRARQLVTTSRMLRAGCSWPPSACNTASSISVPVWTAPSSTITQGR